MCDVLYPVNILIENLNPVPDERKHHRVTDISGIYVTTTKVI